MIGKKFPKLISYKILVIAIIPFSIFQILNAFINDGIFWGLIGIALTLLGIGLPAIWVYKKRTTEFEETIKFLEKIVSSQVDEKLAVLQTYPLEVPNWLNRGNEYINLIMNRISYDIIALTRLRQYISDEQLIAINEALNRLISVLKNNNLDIYRVDAVRQILNKN